MNRKNTMQTTAQNHRSAQRSPIRRGIGSWALIVGTCLAGVAWLPHSHWAGPCAFEADALEEAAFKEAVPQSEAVQPSMSQDVDDVGVQDANAPKLPDEVRDAIKLTWKGKRIAYADLPEEVGEWPRKALQEWGPFTEQHGLALHLTDGGRVLLIQRKKLKPSKNLKLIAKTAKLVDGYFPVPEREEPTDTKPAEPENEDPDGVYFSWSYETQHSPLESETAVLIQVPDADLYELVLHHAAGMNSYLGDWMEEGRALTGFILERPLVACWQERPDGMEEWDIQNELVHRLAQLLVLRRFSQLPYWLTMGFAWIVEEKSQGGIYCFPYRTGFVWATEHGGWLPRIRNNTKRLEEGEFQLELITRWKRGSYDELSALMAFGTAHFLTQQFEPEELSAAIESLRILRKEKSRQDNGDGTWNLIPNFELPTEDQEACFKSLHPEFTEKLHEAFLKGKGYKLKGKSKKRK